MAFGSFRLNTLSAAVSAVVPPVATGGTITYPVINGKTYKVHKFTTAGSFVVSTGGTVDAVIVGGGGSGGRSAFDANYAAGGGGGGQVLYQQSIAITPQTYSITIGDGGTIGSNATGVNGSATTALGYTANGGGYGGARGVGTSVTGGQGGGGGWGSNIGYAGGTGTYNGGSGSTTTYGASGGGGGATQAGANASGNNGGKGGDGYNLNGIVTTSNSYVGAGSGGAPVAGGGGTVGAAGLGGKAGTTNGTGLNGDPNTGAGGSGSYTSGGAAKGGDGGSGVVYIRYPITPVTTLTLIDAKTTLSTASGNFVLPTTGLYPDYLAAQAGDIAVFFDTSTTTTNTIPTGYTSIDGSTTTGIRTNISYKILTSGDLGGTITGMAGVNRKVMLIYRPNSTINSISITGGSVNTQATTAVPTNQSLVGEAGPVISFACYASTGAVATRGWSVGSPVEYSQSTTSSIYVKALVTNSGTPSTTTISMSDGGTNTLQSFTMKVV